MRGIAVDAGAGTARVEAGVLAGEAADAAGAHGLAPALGFAATVGVAGLTLGGGTGWLSRAYGLGANNIRALEVVTADGEHRRVDAQTEPELFWALRGSGGRVAIVTALELAAASGARGLRRHGGLARRARGRRPRPVPALERGGPGVAGRGVPLPVAAADRGGAATAARPPGGRRARGAPGQRGRRPAARRAALRLRRHAARHVRTRRRGGPRTRGARPGGADRRHAATGSWSTSSPPGSSTWSPS